MNTTPGRPSRWRRLMARRPAKIAAVVLFTLFLFELAARVATSVTLGPGVLLYGTRFARGVTEHQTWDEAAKIQDKDVVTHGSGAASYTKYEPSRSKTMPILGGEKGTARINNHGFRGADFAQQKAPGVLRVITLGASSTFGYFDHDDETYPAFLQEYLAQALAEHPIPGFRSVEVLNFGIPHLESDQIRALFEAEALPADPDVVTFYEGVNDTRRLKRSLSERTFNWLAERLMLLRWVQLTLWDRLESFDAEELAFHMHGKADFFVGNVAAVADDCKQRGILFLPVSQQATSKSLTHDELRTTSYADEERLLRRKLETEGRLSGLEMVFLIHCDINRGLRAWAERTNQAFVDVVRLFDEQHERYCLVSWVHMSPQGNRLIAAAIGDEILARLRGAD